MTPSLILAPIADIIVRDRLRRVLPDRVTTLQASFALNGHMTPIDLVETDEGLRLIYGAHRIAAMVADGATTIMALLHPKGSFGNEADIVRREIAENFDRFELTVLEKAANVAAMRELHEAEHGASKRGRKAKPVGDEALEEISAKLALNFPEVVQQMLGLSRRDVFRSLKIASIDQELRDKLAAHSVADNQSELLLLAAQSHARQVTIVARLLCMPMPLSDNVSEAIAQIDKVQAAKPLPPYERVSDAFSRLKPVEQDRFFELHADAIDRWLAAREAL